MNNIFLFISSFAFIGFIKFAPGTFGTIAGLLPLLYLTKLPLSKYFAVLSLAALIGWYCAHKVLTNNNFLNADPKYIVIDEVIGIWLSVFLLLPFYNLNIKDYFIIFVLFRFFDIIKPYPICFIDKKMAEFKQTAALGIMLDDVLAAIFAAFSFFVLKKAISFAA